MEIIYRMADKSDCNETKELLKRANLTGADIDGHIKNFILAIDGDKIAGSAGVEIYGEYGLFRSFAVELAYRGRGIGKSLYDKMVEFSKEEGIKELFLLTKTAEEYFKKNGFVLIGREKVPSSIRETLEFTSICPASAVCMRLILV